MIILAREKVGFLVLKEDPGGKVSTLGIATKLIGGFRTVEILFLGINKCFYSPSLRL